MDVAKALEHLGGLVFFDSSGNLGPAAEGAFSVISAAPIRELRGSIFCDKDQAALRSLLKAGCEQLHAESISDRGSSIDERGIDLAKLPSGGLFGWLSYEGDYVFGEYQEMIARDERTGDWWESGTLSEKLSKAADNRVEFGEFHAEMTRGDYLVAVGKIKEWIAAGDIYQVNLAQLFKAEVKGTGSMLGFYELLREVSPAPMGGWMAIGGIEMASSSPESFLQVVGDQVTTRPIKGTRPRFTDQTADEKSAAELKASEKEAAELVMITDLLRNDLGKVCEYGSVRVERILELESLGQVHHLVSTVQGTLGEAEDAVSALAACFPGGSITGAPKIRAMEIIKQLEDRPRGLYCGAMGWLAYDGGCHFNITIRTLLREGTEISYGVGAGIVADSNPAAEYEETMQKAKGIRLALTKYRESQ